MQRNLLNIIWLPLLPGFASVIYYLSLLVGLPFIVPVLLVVAFGYFSYSWLGTYVAVAETTSLSKTQVAWSYAILTVGVIIITNKSYYIAPQYGYWDSWTIWNYHAKFLQDPAYRKYLFSLNPELHADYPLYLSASIAFLRRLTGCDNFVVPYALGYAIQLLVPVSIYLALYRKNLPIAALAFFLIITDDFYLERGLGQYADVPLALLFLCAFICIEEAKKKPGAILVAAAMIGCFGWVKNEGLMLAAIFILFNIRTLLAGGRWKYFLAGIALPAITLIIFKSQAPANDLISGQGPKTSEMLTDSSRYAIVWEYLTYTFNHYYIPLKIGLIAYFIFCIAERRWPSRNIVALLCCIVGYCIVYLLTPKSIDWHVHTSMDRVLMQLMPSFMYLMALRFSRLRFTLADQSA